MAVRRAMIVLAMSLCSWVDFGRETCVYDFVNVYKTKKQNGKVECRVLPITRIKPYSCPELSYNKA